MDGDAERLLHGLDQPARTAVVGGVDLLRPAGLGDRHVEVAWDRHHLRLAVHEAEQRASCRSAGRRRRRSRPGRARRRRGLRRRGSRSRRSGSWCRCRRSLSTSASGIFSICRTPTWRRGSRRRSGEQEEQREDERGDPSGSGAAWSAAGPSSAAAGPGRGALGWRGRRGGCALRRTRAGRRIEHGCARVVSPRPPSGIGGAAGRLAAAFVIGGRDVDLALVAPGGSVDHGRTEATSVGPAIDVETGDGAGRPGSAVGRQLQRGGVHAVALAGGAGAVGEHVAEVGVAAWRSGPRCAPCRGWSR